MKRILVFLMSMLSVAALLVSPAMAAEKKKASQVIAEKNAELKEKEMKIRQLELDLAKSSVPTAGKKNEPEKPCSFILPTTSFIASGTVGWGVGGKNKGAEIAGATVLLASLISAGQVSNQCLADTATGSLAGFGPGFWFGQKYDHDQKEKAAKEALVTNTSGTTSSTTTGGTLPPPPPPAPSANARMSVGLVPATNADFGNVAYVPKSERLGWMVTATFSFKNLPFIE